LLNFFGHVIQILWSRFRRNNGNAESYPYESGIARVYGDGSGRVLERRRRVVHRASVCRAAAAAAAAATTSSRAVRFFYPSVRRSRAIVMRRRIGFRRREDVDDP